MLAPGVVFAVLDLVRDILRARCCFCSTFSREPLCLVVVTCLAVLRVPISGTVLCGFTRRMSPLVCL